MDRKMDAYQKETAGRISKLSKDLAGLLDTGTQKMETIPTGTRQMSEKPTGTRNKEPATGTRPEETETGNMEIIAEPPTWAGVTRGDGSNVTPGTFRSTDIRYNKLKLNLGTVILEKTATLAASTSSLVSSSSASSDQTLDVGPDDCKLDDAKRTVGLWPVTS